jgi:hypothetical protein
MRACDIPYPLSDVAAIIILCAWQELYHVMQREKSSQRLPSFSSVARLVELQTKQYEGGDPERMLQCSYEALKSIVPKPRNPMREQYENSCVASRPAEVEADVRERATLLHMVPEDCEYLVMKLKDALKSMREVRNVHVTCVFIHSYCYMAIMRLKIHEPYQKDEGSFEKHARDETCTCDTCIGTVVFYVCLVS